MNVFNNNNFYGKLHGKSIRDFSKLDYSIIRSDNRIKYVNDLLGSYQINDKDFYDEFFEELFDTTERQRIKIHLSKDDSVYSTSNIAIYLERLGTYILNSKEQVIDGEVLQKKELKYKVYNSKELFRRACQEDKFINGIASINGGRTLIDNYENCQGEAFPIFRAVDKNYNKVKDIVFEGKKDTDKYPVLKDYSDFYNHLQTRLKHEDANFMLANVIHGVRDDLNNCKALLEKPIVFKSPLTPSPSSMFEDYDIPTKKEIKHMLQITYDTIDDIDKVCTLIDFNNIVDKCKFTMIQKKTMMYYRVGLSFVQIAKIMKQNEAQTKATINSVCRIIENKYWEEYEERYRTFVVKGTWKKCSKCGEVKLVQHFHKKGKEGFNSQCKICYERNRKS